jgi:hypothetical protein
MKSAVSIDGTCKPPEILEFGCIDKKELKIKPFQNLRRGLYIMYSPDFFSALVGPNENR